MKEYYIYNRVTHEARACVYANSAQEACEQQNWRIGDCYVKELKQGPHQ